MQKAEKEGSKESSFYGTAGYYNYTNSISDLLLAGTETVATFMTSVMMYMVNFPSVLDRTRAELHNTIGRKRLPVLADRQNLPYVQAVILEILRHANIAPFAIPHAAAEDTVFEGYHIPKNTMIFPMTSEVH